MKAFIKILPITKHNGGPGQMGRLICFLASLTSEHSGQRGALSNTQTSDLCS